MGASNQEALGITGELDRLLRAFAEIDAKQALHELNVRYCYGVDRRDQQLLASLWWPESEIDFGLFKGTGKAFAELICAPNPAVEVSYHFASNELFEVDGDRATGRSYVIGVTSIVGENGKTDQLVGGRYLDKYQRKDGIWKFTDRLFVLDWNINQPGSAIWTEGIGALARRGRSDRDDVSYSFFQS